jgi:hypothetical protein
MPGASFPVPGILVCIGTAKLDGSCVVNIVDIVLVASRWGTTIGDGGGALEGEV